MGFGAKTRFLSSCKAKVVPYLLEWKEPWPDQPCAMHVSAAPNQTHAILPAKQGQHER